MDGRSGLQLLPGTKKKLGIKVPGENRFLYVGSVILGAVLVSFFALNRYESSLVGQVKDLNTQLVTVEQRRNKNNENELRILQDRIRITSELIKEHRYWTQALDWISGSLQGDVQLETISMDVGGKLSFTALAANYTVVARQIAALLNDNKISDLRVGTILAQSNSNVKFDLQMRVDFNKIIKK